MSRPHPAQCDNCKEAFMEGDCIKFPRLCPKCWRERNDALAKIPPEFKCSRCGGDLRDTGPYRCDCLRNHPFAGNKSGGQFMRTTIEYKGNK